MSPLGDDDLLVATRRALLDALEALQAHIDSIIVVGAQAIYLHTGPVAVALAETTKDSDLALDVRTLAGEPRVEELMSAAGFELSSNPVQPGAWVSPTGIPVDLMVPEALAGARGRRGARIPPHSNLAARQAVGLEAAIADHVPMLIAALDAGDVRSFMVNTATPAALLVAKLHKLGERQEGTPGRLSDKDAHDIYRLLVATPTDQMASALRNLRRDSLAGRVTEEALRFLADLFAVGPHAVGSMMAGRAEEGVGDPSVVSASVAALATSLLDAIGPRVSIAPSRRPGGADRPAPRGRPGPLGRGSEQPEQRPAPMDQRRSPGEPGGCGCRGRGGRVSPPPF